MIEFETEIEKFLYEERKKMMIERDDALEELAKLKKKSKDTFSVFMLSIPDESNGGYHHPTHNATMYIKKGGLSITLDPDEIKQVVGSAGGNFKR
jgi:hypothetical protein